MQQLIRSSAKSQFHFRELRVKQTGLAARRKEEDSEMFSLRVPFRHFSFVITLENLLYLLLIIPPPPPHPVLFLSFPSHWKNKPCYSQNASKSCMLQIKTSKRSFRCKLVRRAHGFESKHVSASSQLFISAALSQ